MSDILIGSRWKRKDSGDACTVVRFDVCHATGRDLVAIRYDQSPFPARYAHVELRDCWWGKFDPLPAREEAKAVLKQALPWADDETIKNLMGEEE